MTILDIDHFKLVNDTYGHPVGDEVIRKTAEILRDTIRSTDVPGRYGGEEFGVLMFDNNAGDSLSIVERLRTSVEELVVYFAGRSIRFSISVGLAAVSDHMKSYKDWIAAADEALYESKRAGRNRSTIYYGHQI